MHFRGVFHEAVSKIRISKEERTLIRQEFEDFTKLPVIFSSGLISTVYASYDSKFYVDDTGLSEFLKYVVDTYNITLTDIKPADVDVADTVPITDYDSFEDIIREVRVLMTTKEARVRKEELYAINKEHEKERDRESARVRNRLSSRLPKSMKDLKILALDFEYDQNKGQLVFECGITEYHNGVMQYEHYLIEENYKNKRNYELQLQFQFGVSKVVSMQELMTILHTRLQEANYLVGHCLLSEYLVLAHHGLDIMEMKTLTCMDTQKLFRSHFMTSHHQNNLSLTNLLGMFDIQADFMHNAGNDAAYTMMALLKIVGAVEQALKNNPERRRRIDLRKKEVKVAA
jgi:hypothetical protein